MHLVGAFDITFLKSAKESIKSSLKFEAFSGSLFIENMKKSKYFKRTQYEYKNNEFAPIKKV